MTALSGPIVFSSAAGASDTAASGCGPSTPVNVMVQTSAGSNTATASPTTGYSSGDIMYIPDASFTGRRYNVITSVTSGSITFDKNWDDSSFGTSGYVGGKRATLQNSLELFSDDLGTHMVVELESDQTLTSTIAFVSNTGHAGLVVRSSEAGAKRTITQTSDSTDLFTHDTGWNTPDNITFQDIKFLNTASVKGRCCYQPAQNGHAHLVFYRCQVGATGSGFTDGYRNANYSSGGAIETTFIDCDKGFNFHSTWRQSLIQNCYFKDCDYGWYHRTNLAHKPVIINSVFDSCTTAAVRFDMNQLKGVWETQLFSGSIFYNNAIAIDIGAYDEQCRVIFTDLLFEGNTTAINGVAGTKISLTRTGFYNNTTDVHSNITIDQNYAPLNLSASSLVDPANGDMNINNSYGGGSVLRSTKYTLGG